MAPSPTGQGVFSGTAEGVPRVRCQRTGQTGDEKIGIDVVGNGHGRGSFMSLRERWLWAKVQLSCSARLEGKPRRQGPGVFLRLETGSTQSMALGDQRGQDHPQGHGRAGNGKYCLPV